MSSINFTGLQKQQVTNNNYTFVDLHLDMETPVDRDLRIDTDETAVRNSIFNLFNTVPGQNLLNPNYGLNLAQYLFEPTTTITARQIGERILKDISLYEPRVEVSNINVEANKEEQMYIITLSISIPQLNKNVKVSGNLTRSGYIIS